MTAFAPAKRENWLALASAACAVYCAVEATRYFVAQGARGRFHIESYLFILVAGVLLAGLLGGPRPGPVADANEPAPFVPSILGLGGFVVAAAILYAPALSLGLLSDDYVLRAVGRTGEAWLFREGRFYRPLASLLLAELSPGLLHALSVTLHGANAWLVLCLGAAMETHKGVALAGAGLFLTFPAAVEAVAWCSGIQDVLLTTTALLFVLVWRTNQSMLSSALIALGLQLFALTTKETAAAFPLLGLVLWALSPRIAARRVVLLTCVAGLAVTTYAACRLSAGELPIGSAQPPSRWLLKEIFVRTFGALAVPWHEALGLAGLGLGIVVGILLPLVLATNAQVWPGARSGLWRSIRLSAWVVASVAPVYSLLFVARNLEGSRYVYLAAAGWSLLLAELVGTALASYAWGRRAAIAATTAWMVAGVAATRAHLGPWQEAARVRDRVLRSAESALRGASCEAAIFQDVPDNVEGAYVFRNGLSEALGLLPAGATEGNRRCLLVWNGRRFRLR